MLTVALGEEITTFCVDPIAPSELAALTVPWPAFVGVTTPDAASIAWIGPVTL
jgi:hypothetical protein